MKLAPKKQNTIESYGESVLKLRLHNIVIKPENRSKPLKTSVDMQLAGTKKLKLIAACAALTPSLHIQPYSVLHSTAFMVREIWSVQEDTS